MKITYNENPLKTTVELDDHDKQVFWLKIKIEELQDRLFDVHFNLQPDDYYDLDRARTYCDPVNYIQEDDAEKVAVDKRVDRLLESFTKELMGEHCGDCTRVACSCLKCRAEDILGVNTLAGLGELSQIGGAFGKGRGLVDALAYLKDHKISREKPAGWTRSTQEEYEKYIPGWEAQQTRAYEYLRAYAEEHFPVIYGKIFWDLVFAYNLFFDNLMPWNLQL